MSPSHDPPQLSLSQLAVVESIFTAVAIGIGFVRHDLTAFSIAGQVSRPALALAASAALGWFLGAGLLHSRLRQPIIQASRPFQAIISTTWSILFASAFAGVGEELLFRAALQRWLGIWIASLAFVLVHSATARLHEGLSIGKLSYLFGTLVAGLALGYLYLSAGLLTAISAHAGFDAALLMALGSGLARVPAGGAASRGGPA